MKFKQLLQCLMSVILGSGFLQAQVTVSGKVTDARDGNPVSQVNVTAAGSNTGTSTDANGNYRISVPANSTLIFSSVGYKTREIAVTGSTLNVVLDQAEGNLQEVVLTGYTVQTRREATAALAKVNGESVRLQPVASFDQLLTGKASGVLVQSQSGQPGAAASNISIRGKGSVLASTQPLFIIDGIQVTGADFQSINPADIETFTVLKDAVATSQYGSRGANGVIVISTKRGTNAKTRISYDYQFGVGALPVNKLKLMNSAEKIFFETTYDHPYGMNFFGWTTAEADSLSLVQADWENVLFRKAKTQQHQLSISGGTDKTKLFLSGSVFDQEGLVRGTALKRYTGRMNLDHTTGNLRIGLSTFIGTSRLTNTTENDQYIGDPLNAIRWANPYVTPYNPDGSYNNTDMLLQGQPNALQEQLENKRLNQQLKGIAALTLEYKLPFLKGLSAKTNWGTDFTDNSTSTYIDKSTYLGSQQSGRSGSYARGSLRRIRYTGTNSISYNGTSRDHRYRVSLFNEYVLRRTESFNYTGFGLTGVFGNGADITTGTPTNNFIPRVAEGRTEQSLLSYFALADYSFKNRYFINASFRRDGSSRLAEGNKWVNYAGAGFSWLLHEENFMKNASWLNELKWRISYGAAGNEDVGDSYESLEQFSGVSYNGLPALVLTNLSKPELTWEVRKTFNSGLDFSILNSRIHGTIEYYNATTHGLYLNRQLSGTNGLSFILTNLGKIRNKGIELSLGAEIIRTTNLQWNVSINHTYNRAKVLSLDGSNENVNGISINRIGERPNSIYLVRYAGVDSANGDALYYKADGKTTTNIYDPQDRVITGTYDAPHFGAVNSSVNYKGLQLSFQFNYIFGHAIYNNDRANVENPAYVISNVSRELLNEWQKPGDVTRIPSPYSNFELGSTRFQEKGDFLRLRNVLLSYDLPAHILSRARINALRLFVQAQNLYTWHQFKGYDPEIATGTLQGSQYPQLKTWTFGLNIGL